MAIIIRTAFNNQKWVGQCENADRDRRLFQCQESVVDTGYKVTKTGKKREIDEIEAGEHIRALHEFLSIYDLNHQFTADDICSMHKNWLGSVYKWAGRYRQVNISKGGFFFISIFYSVA